MSPKKVAQRTSCPECGKKGEFKFCPDCGAACSETIAPATWHVVVGQDLPVATDLLSPHRQCRNCAATLRPGGLFCGKCGAPAPE